MGGDARAGRGEMRGEMEMAAAEPAAEEPAAEPAGGCALAGAILVRLRAGESSRLSRSARLM